MQTNTAVVINRPKHWSHLIQGEVIGQRADGRWQVKILHYLNNAQSFNPNIKLRSSNPAVAGSPMQAEIDVLEEFLLENTAANKEQINKLTREAED